MAKLPGTASANEVRPPQPSLGVRPLKALIVANHFLETELEKLPASVSIGYARGKLLPRDRKDWYD